MGAIANSVPPRVISAPPRHPYTGALISAVPGEDLLDRKLRMMLPGEVPSPIKPTPACRLGPGGPLRRARAALPLRTGALPRGEASPGTGGGRTPRRLLARGRRRDLGRGLSTPGTA